MKVRESLLKYISPKVPVETRRGAASALAPCAPAGEGPPAGIEGIEKLSAADRLTILFILSFDPDQTTAKEAAAGFIAFDSGELITALADKLDSRLLGRLVALHPSDPALLPLIADNPGADAKVKRGVSTRR
jgi:hypothetical protein